ncbi:unnamed protein product [Didymodactylos carnosus]|nr:unnamed protein product [Didymodactylos carnosus]CAF3792198.1 unnamed protein product [Didymodactylos carnosus]
MIYKFRFLINDIHCLLQNAYTLRARHNLDRTYQTTTVYRGQYLTNEELKRLQIHKGSFIVFSSFLSASTSSSVALSFAVKDCNTFLESVLFEIKIEYTGLLNMPHLKVEKFSQFKSENEMLFSLGTIFQIESVNEHSDTLWVVQLRLSNDQTLNIPQKLKDIFQKSNSHEHLERFILTDQVFKADEQDFIKKCFTEEFTSNTSAKASLYISVGRLYGKIENYEMELIHYDKAVNSLPTNHSFRSLIYHSIATINFEHSDFDAVLENCQKMINAMTSNTKNLAGLICQNFANIYETIFGGNEQPIVIKVCIEVMNLLLKSFPDYFPKFVPYYAILAYISVINNDSSMANDYFNKAVNDKKYYYYLSAVFYKTLADLYYIKNKHSEAFKNYENALDQYRKAYERSSECYFIDQSFNISLFSKLRDYNERAGKYAKALEYLEIMIRIENDLVVDFVYHGRYQYLEKFLINSSGYKSQNDRNYIKGLAENQIELHRSIINYFLCFALYQRKHKNYIQELDCYEKCIKKLPMGHKLVPLFYHCIGSIHYNLRDYETAIENLKRGIYFGINKINYPSVALSYEKLAEIYDQENQFTPSHLEPGSLVLENYRKAIEIRFDT